jgi:D-alanyl-D-alanine carboxypeptidase-like protein
MRRRKAESVRSRQALILLPLLVATSARANDVLDSLVAAYPATLAGHDVGSVTFRNGVRLDAGALHEKAPLEWLLSHASIRDQFLLSYPRSALTSPPADNFDPGRYRNRAFFNAMYGNCGKGEVEDHLVSVVWLPQSWGKAVRVTRVNGVAMQLRAVSDEIEKLPLAIRRAAWPIEGDYDCRNVADDGQPSMHAYGAAVDLNLHWSGYWLWDEGQNARVIRYRNRMPQDIVDAFERHGFIWGGKWYHYDTMHFEYRPELLPLAPAPPLR